MITFFCRQNRVTLVILTILALMILLSLSNYAWAYKEDSYQVLADITQQYRSVLQKSASFFKTSAVTLFVLLAVISIVWKLIPIVLQGDANISSVFVEMIKMTLIFGVFLALLSDGSPIEITKLGEILIDKTPEALIAKGYDTTGKISFSYFPDLGFAIIQRTLGSASWTSPFASTISVVLAIAILVLLTLIGLKYLLLTIEAWLTLYGGILMIGFAGLESSREIAVSYIKALIALAFQLFIFVLLALTGKNVMLDTLNANPTINWNIIAGLVMEAWDS